MASPAMGVIPTHTRIRGHGGSVNWLATFIVDGTAFVASGSDDRTVRFWRPDSEARLIECGCVSGFPDGIVAGSLAGPAGEAGATRLLTVAAGTRILRTSLSVSRGGVVEITGGAITSLLAARDDIGGLAVRGDDGAVVSADEDGDVVFTDAALTRVLATARCAHASLGSCADAALLSETLEADGGGGGGAGGMWTAVTGGTDHTLLMWDWARRRVVERLSFGAAQEAPPGVVAGELRMSEQRVSSPHTLLIFCRQLSQRSMPKPLQQRRQVRSLLRSRQRSARGPRRRRKRRRPLLQRRLRAAQLPAYARVLPRLSVRRLQRSLPTRPPPRLASSTPRSSTPWPSPPRQWQPPSPPQRRQPRPRCSQSP